MRLQLPKDTTYAQDGLDETDPEGPSRCWTSEEVNNDKIGSWRASSIPCLEESDQGEGNNIWFEERWLISTIFLDVSRLELHPGSES